MKTNSTSKAAARLGRRGGLANTPAQNEARAANAQRAGRPRRLCRFCAEPVLGGHVDRRRDESCGAHGWLWAKRNDAARRPVRPDPRLLPELLAVLDRMAGELRDDVGPRAAARLLGRLRRAVDALS